MLPERIQIKLFLTEKIDLTDLIPIFHRWIQENELDGLLIDVADYRHVPNGPGLLLMGHEGDYALDVADGRPGVTYKHKRDWPIEAETFTSRLALTMSRALRAAELLNRDAVLTVDLGRIEIRFADRLALPNTAESFESIREVLQSETQDHLGPIGTISNLAADDPRKALTLEIVLDPVLV